MLRSVLLPFALLATVSACGLAHAQNTPGTPNTQPPLPGNPNTQPPLPGNPNTQPAPDPASTYASAPTSYAPVAGGGVNRPYGPVRISGGVMAGQVMNKVDPVYPQEARDKHISGTVVLSVRIGKDGTVQDIQPISGPAVFREPAMDAVKQWTYKPYLLNGQPTEVQTTVTVNFALAGPPETPQR